MVAMARSGDATEYLNATRPNYEIYRYIGTHNLAQVMQPFDNGGILYASAYNNGQKNRWVLPFFALPKDKADAEAFLARSNIHYYIRPQKLEPSQIERLGPEGIALALQLMDGLKARSRLVLRDQFGTSLYEILPKAST
jgi:hypothetical protein